MTIDAKSIDTDLTLELDEDEITAAEFSAAFEHFLGLVREVTRAIAPNRHPIWLIKVYPGSAGIGFSPKFGALTADEMGVVRNAVLSGIETMERGQRPSHFTDKAIQHARGISHAFRSRRSPTKVRIWNRNERSLAVKPVIEETANKILDAIYEDEGSVEGTLEVLSGHGKFEVVLYDTLDGRAIKCEVGQEEIRTSLDSFMQRVEVFGRVRYRKDGLPVSVKVDRIIPFPSKDQIPLVQDVKGILRD